VQYVRFLDGDQEGFGTLEGSDVSVIEGNILAPGRPTGERRLLAQVRLLAPIPRPGKILAAAVNYQSHAAGASAITKREEPPAIPQLFLKPSSSVIGPEETIMLPDGARRVDAEGELVAVIGRVCRSVDVESALDYVLGYTCGNDVSARHWQRDDLQWWRAKGSDTFSPIGPAVDTELDPGDVELRTLVNGEEKQRTRTSGLIHSVAALISFASRVCTLEPGDLVFTGTPGETPKLNDGDVVEVGIAGIGVLRNPVVREQV
jgi:2-keto-4-pentenoate hydratase/2-oxohepta-3-ene-1,7-dioic acid hydratase in catechol pathway